MDQNDNVFKYSVEKHRKKRNNKKRYVYYPKKVNPDDTMDSSRLDDSLVDKDSDLNINEGSENDDNGENSSEYAIKIVESFEEEDTNSNTGIQKDAMMSTSPKLPPSEKIEEWEKEENISSIKEEQNQQYNVRALSKQASTYELEKFEKNALIIFNQENIQGYNKPRLGTQKDVDALKESFGKFGFEVIEHTDLTKDEVFKELKTFSETDFTNYGCVAVAVLTHGTKNGLLKAKDTIYSEAEILSYFKIHDKPTLVTKPKILIIQACRGTKSTVGVPVLLAGKIRKDLDDELEPYYLPVESDMLVLHSSYAGNPSHRDELYGSWFIQSLCSKINELAPAEDLESIITKVKKEVAIDKYHEEYNRRTFELDTNKQMPVLTSTLIRKLYLRKYGESSPITIVTDCSLPDKLQLPSNEVLDTSVPNTPLRLQFGPCSCYLNHFDYIRDCLRYLIEENPHDHTAQAFLDLADTFEDGVEFNTTKEKMHRVICNHLTINYKDWQYYKFLYLFKN